MRTGKIRGENQRWKSEVHDFVEHTTIYTSKATVGSPKSWVLSIIYLVLTCTILYDSCAIIRLRPFLSQYISRYPVYDSSYLGLWKSDVYHTVWTGCKFINSRGFCSSLPPLIFDLWFIKYHWPPGVGGSELRKSLTPRSGVKWIATFRVLFRFIVQQKPRNIAEFAEYRRIYGIWAELQNLHFLSVYEYVRIRQNIRIWANLWNSIR